MKRFHHKGYDYLPGSEMVEHEDGDYVLYDDVQKLVEALKKIRDQDYRGNVPASVEIARQTLKELGIE